MKKSKELIGPKDQMIKVVQRFPQYILQIKVINLPECQAT